MSRTLKNQQLYIQEEHNMFINPSPLIPLPSVSFQCKTFRTMLVRGKMFAGGAGRGQGEGRLKFLTLKNLGVID